MPGPSELRERDRELAGVDALISDAFTGAARMCVVEGPPGIGKSRLVAAAKEHATERGFAVLSATGSAFESGFGFGVVTQLFEAVVRSDPERLLSGIVTPAGAVVGPDRDPDPADHSAEPSFAALHALYWLTVRIGEQRPLLFAIDDLHWCDPSSLRFLAYLRARLEGTSIAVVCSLRTSEQATSPALLGALLDDPTILRLHPQPLSEHAATGMIADRLPGTPEPAFATACHRATGGNPLLLEQLLSALAAAGASPDEAHLAMLTDLVPSSVVGAVLLRLSRLGADVTEGAQALAILGDGADLSTIATLAGLDVERAGRALAALARAEIVRGEAPYGFVHPVVAAAVYRDLPPGARGLQHLHAAELLAASNAPNEQVAGHLVHTPGRAQEWVVDRLTEAAAAATRKGAPDGAVTYLTRAMAEPPSPRRRAPLALALGRAQALTDGPGALEHLQVAHAAAEDAKQRAQVADVLGRVLLFTGHVDEGVQILHEAAVELPSDLVDLARRLEAVELFSLVFGVGEPDALRRLERHRATPVPDGLGATMLAAAAAQAWRYAGGPSEAVAELSLAALASGELVDAESGWAASLAITNLSYADRTDAEDWWQRATTSAHQRGSLPDIIAIMMWRGSALHRRGELADAEASLRDCLAGLKQWGYDDQAPTNACAHLASVLHDRGDVHAARSALALGRDSGGHDDATRAWLGSHLELLVAERSFELALAAADHYACRFDYLVRNPVDVPWRSLKALALDQLGGNDEARELAAAELELSRAWGAPSTVARTLRVLGTVERDQGIGHLEEAVATVAGSPARLEWARSLTALGSALRRARQPAQSRAPLREALDLATACGADAVAERARTELYAAGGRPRRTALTGAGSLTASEHRVVDLAAAGASNREIGEALFVTPKTVAMHLSNSYRKLGVTSRHHLAAALRD